MTQFFGMSFKTVNHVKLIILESVSDLSSHGVEKQFSIVHGESLHFTPSVTSQ